MINLLEEKIKSEITHEAKVNILRESLQLIVLKIMDEKGWFRHLAFLGGTALRILYDLKRFSEDLDFSLIDRKNYNFSDMMPILEKELKLNGLDASIRCKDKKTVASAFLSFQTLLFNLGLSPHEDQKLQIKFEVDQNPPQGYQTQFTMINKDYLLGVNHFDLPSLFAGKLHAILCRKYTKGRDYYDFIWYCAKKVTPNYLLLNNAILQTQKENPLLDNQKLKQLLVKHFEHLDFGKIAADVAPFLQDAAELRHFRQEIFMQLANDLGQ